MIDESLLGRHEKIALSFSGGKDSLACVYMLRPWLDRITLYHLDTGDLLPETREVVDHVRAFWPRFVDVRTDAFGWIEQHGLPTDLLPYGSHFLGRAAGQEREPLVPRYDCCFINLMRPIFDRICADGNTLLIRGTKAADVPKLPLSSGAQGMGIELYFPIEGWSHAQVFDYLRSVGAPISRVYDYVENSPECARCSAWWSEKRAKYLRTYHPDLFRQYRARLVRVAAAIEEPLTALRNELMEEDA